LIGFHPTFLTIPMPSILQRAHYLNRHTHFILSLSLSSFPFLLTLMSKVVQQQSLDHNHIPLPNLHRLSFLLSLFLSLHEICAFGP
jgi:hypothetical protein